MSAIVCYAIAVRRWCCSSGSTGPGFQALTLLDRRVNLASQLQMRVIAIFQDGCEPRLDIDCAISQLQACCNDPHWGVVVNSCASRPLFWFPAFADPIYSFRPFRTHEIGRQASNSRPAHSSVNSVQGTIRSHQRALKHKMGQTRQNPAQPIDNRTHGRLL